MQAIILAAGKGSRLGKHTKENTKCMLELHGEKLIDYALKSLVKNGVTKVVMVVGYQRDNLMEYLGESAHGATISYVVNEDYDTTNNIYSLYLARDFLLQDDTLLLESDLIFDDNIITNLLADKRPSLAVVDRYASWMDGTVVMLDDKDRITNFVPKKFFDYTLVDKYYKTVNIYKFSKEFSKNTYVPFLKAYSAALGNNEYYEQVLRVVVELENQELEAFQLSGERWYEIDDVQDKNNAETIFAPSATERLTAMQSRYGGYWRFPYVKDFCYLVNPYFPNKTFIEESKAYFFELVSQYPSGAKVQNLLAAKLFDVEPEQIVVGNGAAEIIKVLGDVLPGRFGVMQPTFYEYVDAIGSERIETQVMARDDYSYTADELLSLGERVENLILINPDNPSGHILKRTDVERLAATLKSQNKMLILDESFLDFADDGFNETLFTQEYLERYPNLLVIKSISKSYGVPGVRLGVAASSDIELMTKIQKALGIWNINSFGEFFLQTIGKYKAAYIEGCYSIWRERARFFKALSEISFLTVYPSQANYFMCKVNERYSSDELTKRLLDDADLLIKDLAPKFGFDGKSYVRIAIRDQHDNDLLVSALKQLEASK